MATIDARTITRLRAAAAAAPAARLRIGLPTATFVLTALARTWHINRHFWMLGDQIRDWSIALGPITSLPLVGPATHVGGYTIGPAFYWILWLIRVVVGPWFQNLPHAGGIGQALLQSGVDALLLLAVWNTGLWLGVAAVCSWPRRPRSLLSATSGIRGGIDPGETATALILLDCSAVTATSASRLRSRGRGAAHGAIFVAIGVFAALVAEDGIGALARAPSAQCAHRRGGRRASSSDRAPDVQRVDSAMGAVTGSIADVVRGRARFASRPAPAPTNKRWLTSNSTCGNRAASA